MRMICNNKKNKNMPAILHFSLGQPVDGEGEISYISVMTEKTVYIDEMPPAVKRFVLQWGDMGSQWGVNRSVAQIQALLFMSERPLDAEEISKILGIARSNVSNSLKELLGWKLIQRVPVPGERRDHYTAVTDVWELTRRITTVRKEREFDPAIETLELCLGEADGDKRVSAEQRKRLEDLKEFTETVSGWYDQMADVPTETLWRFVKMGSGVFSLLGLGGRRKRKTG